MTEVQDAGVSDGRVSDGRAARRERNIISVLDVVVEMFGEGELFPTVEQVSKRSGISVRSIYRYFVEPAQLYDAAIRHHRQLWAPLAHLPAVGEGPLDQRIEDFVAMRIRLYDGVAAAYRATVHNASHHPRVQDELTRSRNDLRLQFELQFAPELAAHKPSQRAALINSGDLLTQLDSLDLLRHHRQLSKAATTEALRVGLAAIFNLPT